MPAVCRPDLGVSQNHLKDPRLVEALIKRSSLGAEDLVYEIGPGKGIITLQLARLCKRVVAIEKDDALSSALKAKCHDLHNLVIHTGDFLLHPLPREPYKVFSNIPFNITSSIVARLTSEGNTPEDAYLVLQKEAAFTFLGKPKETLKSILLQPWFDLKIIHSFSRFDFSPVPHVDAVLLHICKRSPPLISRIDRQPFRDFVVYCCTAWNPTLECTLRNIFSYRQIKQIRSDCGLSPDTIPTSLCFEQWLTLYKIYKAIGNPQAILTVSGSEKRLHRQQKRLCKIHRTRT
jgi:23S rRNA (adenine-N6)-dimethyltransferase